MKLKLHRFEFGTNYTIGHLYINDTLFCFTLEDKVRPNGEKVQGQTAIPKGTYEVIIDFSNRFQRMMPHILPVSGFEGIRIHSGNTDQDTEGCILLGTNWAGGDFISNSKKAFDSFFPQLQEAINDREEVSITIE